MEKVIEGYTSQGILQLCSYDFKGDIGMRDVGYFPDWGPSDASPSPSDSGASSAAAVMNLDQRIVMP